MPKFKHIQEPPNRHKAPLPPERVAEMAFVWDGNGRIIAPWSRHVLWPDEEAKLTAVLDQVSEIGAALRVACWVWPDGKVPVRVESPDVQLWMARWSESRASYVAKRVARA